MLKKKEVVEEKVVEAKPQLLPVSVDFDRLDLIALRDKLNEVIKYLNER